MSTRDPQRFQPPARDDDGGEGVPVDLLAQVQAVTAPTMARPPSNGRTPPDKGLVLAEIERTDGSLVLAWCEYEGKPYLNLRVWTRDGFPTAKGVSIRLRELEPIMRGLLAAERKRRDRVTP